MKNLFSGILFGYICVFLVLEYTNDSEVKGATYGSPFPRSASIEGISIFAEIKLLEEIDEGNYNEIKIFLESSLMRQMFVAASRCEVLPDREQGLLKELIREGNMYFANNPMSKRTLENMTVFDNSGFLKNKYNLFKDKL